MNSDDNIIKLDLPAAPQYLSILSTVIEMYLATVPDVVDREITLYNVKLAAQECCTNIIDHAYSGQEGGRIKARLAIQHEPRRIVIELHDTGEAVEPAAIAEPQLKVGSVRGYGLFLMHELMDKVGYGQDEHGNRWRLVKYV